MQARPALRTVVSGAVAGALLTLVPAPAGAGPLPQPEPMPQRDVVVAARDFNSQVTATVAPGGTATFSSPNIDPYTQKVTLTVMSEDDLEFERMGYYLSHKRLSRGKKLQTCIRMHRLALQGWKSTFIDYELKLENSEKALMTFVTCMHIARLVEILEEEGHGAPARTVRAAKGCAVQPAAYPMKVKKTPSGFTVSGKGKGKAPKKGGPLKVTCKRVGDAMVMTVRPRAKGKSLRSVLGPKVRIGVQSGLHAEESADVTVSFRK